MPTRILCEASNHATFRKTVVLTVLSVLAVLIVLTVLLGIPKGAIVLKSGARSLVHQPCADSEAGASGHAWRIAAPDIEAGESAALPLTFA